ncbi:MAG: hypothetical protein AAGA03_08895 [Planctomycetota bacterium]
MQRNSPSKPKRFWLALLFLPLIVGCDGCRPQPSDDDEPEEAQAEAFTSTLVETQPGASSSAESAIKPGHWTTVSQSIKSNKADTRGELQGQATESVKSLADTGATDFRAARQVVLPRGQQRRFDYRLLAPLPRGSGSTAAPLRVGINNRYVASDGSLRYEMGRRPITALAGHQYLFVVLTTRPERFTRLAASDWVTPRRSEEEFADPSLTNYRVVFPKSEGLLALPETFLDWTSTAVLLWDDLPPEALTPNQQRAVTDWLHFGGTLIINGADAANSVVDTALADLLPMRPTRVVELDRDAASALLRRWQVPTDKSTEKQIATLADGTARLAVDGTPEQQSKSIDQSGDLVLQRRIGRGRIVQPRFDIASDWISDWHSYDSFVNGLILARPRRKHIAGGDYDLERSTVQLYADSRDPRAPATINTRLRFLSRDAALTTESGSSAKSVDGTHLDLSTRADPISGVAGWSPTSDIMNAVREVLRDEAGIEIPSSTMVVRSLGLYLLFLIPVNYVVFRLVSRLEYAWMVVPLIAIAGVVWVTRAVRLDIGFARSQTSIDVVELQPGYQRGHLCRTTVLYNSLSSGYSVQFDTIDGAATPLTSPNSRLAPPETIFRTGDGEGPVLEGIQVPSNSFGWLHIEQMCDLGGTIVRQKDSILNDTDVAWEDAWLIEHDSGGTVRIAVVGACDPGREVSFRLVETGVATVSDEFPLQVGRVIEKLTRPESLPPGSTRLVARVDGLVAGPQIIPGGSQTRGQTILVAHLAHQPVQFPEPDENLRSDFRDVLTDADAQ